MLRGSHHNKMKDRIYQKNPKHHVIFQEYFCVREKKQPSTSHVNTLKVQRWLRKSSKNELPASVFLPLTAIARFLHLLCSWERDPSNFLHTNVKNILHVFWYDAHISRELSCVCGFQNCVKIKATVQSCSVQIGKGCNQPPAQSNLQKNLFIFYVLVPEFYQEMNFVTVRSHLN